MLISKEMLERAGIEVLGDWDEFLPNVLIDSRAVKKGDCFWGLPGASAHGQEYAPIALEKGASIVAVEKRWGVVRESELQGKVAFLMEDTLLVLQNLAREVRRSLGGRTIGITGSNGKTTTRELIAAALKGMGEVGQNHGNYNNHIGVPLTILNSSGDEDFLVVEMGANHVGEIAYLCDIAYPEVGLITNIGDAHVGEFGGYDALEQAKGELFKHLGEEGLGIINLDDELVLAQSEKVKNKAGYTLGDFPANWNFPVYMGKIVDKDPWSRLTIEIEGNRIKLKLPGEHWGQAVMGAYAIASEMGADPLSAINEMSKLEAIVGRGRIVELGDGVELLDDSYNANFAAIESSLKTLANREGYKIAILGDVLELGEFEEEEHRRIGRIGELDAIDRVYFVGSRMSLAAEEAEMLGHDGISHVNVDEVELLAKEIEEEIKSGAGIVVKGSRLIGLDKVVEELIQIRKS